MDVVFQCEINKFCQGLLKKHWPAVKQEGDIDEVRATDIPRAELWCGGFPCQDLSSANQGRRLGFGGKRSSLFYKFAGLVSDLPEEERPRWLFMENVPGLLNSRGGADFACLLRTLDELGYGVAWRVLDAKFFGTPQRRRRVYIIASRGSNLAAEVFFEQGAVEVLVGAEQGTCGEGKEDAEGESDEENKVNGDAQAVGGCNKETNLFTIQHAAVGRVPEAGPQGKGYRNDGEAYTCDSRGSSDVVCKTDAPFGVREASRISEGLDSNRWRALGNAVCVPVIEWIAKRIAEVDGKYVTKK